LNTNPGRVADRRRQRASSKIDFHPQRAVDLGETSIRRAYGNWKKQELKGWEDQLHEHAIRPMQQYDYSKGKNASDMAMVIDALALLYTDRPDAFGIVSSDADFTPLVMHLREKGAAVYGFGARKTPEPFVNACSRFLFLDKLAAAPDIDLTANGADDREAPSSSAPLRVSPAQLKRDAKLVTLLRNAVTAAQDDDGWGVGAVGQQIGNRVARPRNYGYATLTKPLAATQLSICSTA
jgi:hypothetical protein